MIGARTFRKLALLGATAVLAASSLGSSAALAADTRDVTVGDPSSTSSILLPTIQKGTTDDAAAWFLIRVANNVGSTMTQVHLSVTLPTGIELLAVVGPSGLWPCTVGATVGCSLPNIAGNSSSPTLTFVVHGDAVGTYPGLSASVALKEGNSTNNADVFTTATTSVVVQAGSADDATKWTAPSSTASAFELNDVANGQTTKLILPPSNTGYVVGVTEGAVAPAECGFTDSESPVWYATVNSSALISPYLEWSISFLWTVTPPPSKKQLAEMSVAHCTEAPGGGLVVELISLDCSALVGAPCIVERSYDKRTGFVTLGFRTLKNGYVKGL